MIWLLPVGAAAAGEPHPICSWLAAKGEVTAQRATVCAVLDLRDVNGPRVLSHWPDLVDWLPEGWREADFLLLGEVHDNPGHHELRAASIGPHPVVPGQGRAVVFEHIRADQQPAIDAFMRARSTLAQGRRPGDLDELFRLLAWDTSGWPDKAMFAPLFRRALDAAIPILSGDPPREKVRAVARGGASVLDEAERRRLLLDEPLEARLHEALLGELEASHCGLVPRAAFAGMATAQRYRDAHLAQALAKAAEAHGGAVLLAGNGHLRTDRGVPHHLRRMAPGKRIVSIMLIEVEDGTTEPAAYVPRDPDGRPAADYVLLTPRAERKDPCAEMRERFGKR